ncbi:MAG: TonB-dependent receptor, partial [Treponema sp.]|nr:TonB-dependent receptor [Treponema sp.]
MFKKLLLSLVIVVLCIAVAFPQSGTIKGKVVDHTGEPLSFTYVYLKKEDKAVNYALTGADGAYQIFGIATGTYDVEVDATLTVCKKKVTMQGVQVSDGKTVFLDLKVPCATDLEEFVFVYERPVFDQDNTKSEQTISGDDVRKTPGRSLSAALANMAGVASVDGSISSVRGNRADGQQTIVDGVKIRSGGVAMSSIEEMTLIQGGIPAEYGDGTSFTVITTKGASKDFNGSVELMGSLDGYNNFLAAANVTGPILKGKTKKDPTRIGFLVSAEASYDKDGAPARGGTWRATDETIDRLVKTPVRYVEGGSYFPAISQNADYITKADLKKQRVRDNASAWGYLLQGKLDFVPKKDGTLTISVGGSYDYSKGHNWGGIYYALFNAQNNSMSKASTARVNARINHRAYTDTTSNAILKNIMYNININYSYYNAWTRDRHHGQNYFNYGHIGKFTTKQAESYERQNIT